jgi:signal peptidase I
MLAELLQTLLIAGLLYLLVNQLTARIRVEGNSMEPNLHDGEFVIVNRLAYSRHEPERGDIIVFHSPRNEDKRFIKRVIGLPGDLIVFEEGTVFINGITLDEPYIKEVPTYASNQWNVGPDEVFVLGDNRDDSRDSRSWGNLPQEKIIGKAILVYWPLSEIGKIPHYDLVISASE